MRNVSIKRLSEINDVNEKELKERLLAAGWIDVTQQGNFIVTPLGEKEGGKNSIESYGIFVTFPDTIFIPEERLMSAFDIGDQVNIGGKEITKYLLNHGLIKQIEYGVVTTDEGSALGGMNIYDSTFDRYVVKWKESFRQTRFFEAMIDKYREYFRKGREFESIVISYFGIYKDMQVVPYKSKNDQSYNVDFYACDEKTFYIIQSNNRKKVIKVDDILSFYGGCEVFIAKEEELIQKRKVKKFFITEKDIYSTQVKRLLKELPEFVECYRFPYKDDEAEVLSLLCVNDGEKF